MMSLIKPPAATKSPNEKPNDIFSSLGPAGMEVQVAGSHRLTLSSQLTKTLFSTRATTHSRGTDEIIILVGLILLKW